MHLSQDEMHLFNDIRPQMNDLPEISIFIGHSLKVCVYECAGMCERGGRVHEHECVYVGVVCICVSVYVCMCVCV